VDIEVRGKEPLFYDKRLWAHELVLTHRGVKYPSWGASLDLSDFSVSALGFSMPIRVKGRALGLDLDRLHELLRQRRSFDPFALANRLAALGPPSKSAPALLERLRTSVAAALGRDLVPNERTLPVWTEAVKLSRRAVENTLDELECAASHP